MTKLGQKLIEAAKEKGKKCGYPLCNFYDESVPTMTCPTPIEGTACQGSLEPVEEDFEKDHPNTCRCEVCRFWS